MTAPELISAANPPERLLRDLRDLVVDARRQATAAVNFGLTVGPVS
jgi:hypothetical protein